MESKVVKPRAQRYTLLTDVQRNIFKRYVMFAGTDDHLTRLSPVILNLESTGLTHLESEIRVTVPAVVESGVTSPSSPSYCSLKTMVE